ncbi:hypothetical protein [Aestuariivirga sp.]|uniref:hypothetical protein n=1 Tax=Aestuariivirga sp. TaxID=2650926 RepID=UPI0039E3477F
MAWKDAITWLHEYAAGMKDGHATALLNSAAFSLGNFRKSRDRIPVLNAAATLKEITDDKG